jgi:4-amino-4-deoxy-L-arabinose transferase-like glycosyltransferase
MAQIGLFAALLLSNALLLYSNLDWLWLRLPAALSLTFILPGWAWLPILSWLQTRQAIERIVLVVGLSSLFSALVLLFTLLLPGPFTETPVFIALNLVTLMGLLCQFILTSQRLRPLFGHRANQDQSPPTDKSEIVNPKSEIVNRKSKIEWPSRTTLLILLAILATAAFTRLTRLEYAEFHEDDLENMRLIVRAYKGEEYAPFLDSKGPIHWLLPAALWYLNGWLTEGIARTPFAVTALLLIPLMYVLGRRMSGGRDSLGVLAAAFVTVNGFFVAYARLVENQSLIVLWGALAMWFGYRYYTENAPQFLPWLAFTLATGLIAHPDMLLYLPVFVYLIGMKAYQNRSSWLQQWPWLLGAGILFVGLLCLFYIPYLMDPNINQVGQYFAEDRIGLALFYNRVDNLFDQDKLYSTRYHAPILVFLLAWLLIRNFGQWGWRGWGLFSLLALVIVATVARPAAWIIVGLNLAFIPYMLLTLIVLVLPRTTFELKTLFLWFSAPLGALLFLAKDAADHIQIAYTAWALLAAFGLADLWACLSNAGRPAWLSSPVSLGLKAFTAALLLLAVGSILFYQHLAFLAPVTTYWQAKLDSVANPHSIYNRLYGSLPRPRRIFSNPRLGGWKAVGYLWQMGLLSGDFRSINESFAVPVWYTFQTPRSCYSDPQNYWVQRGWEGWPEEEAGLAQQGYTLTRVVLVDRQPKLHLYEKNAPPGPPEIIDMEAYRGQFDRLTTPARFAQAEIISQPASLNFGDKLLLRGFDLPMRVQAGKLLAVTAYWEGLSPMELRYRAFVHLVDAQGGRWGQHDDDPACRLLATEIRPGQRASRQFRIPINPAAPPGEYQVILGLYNPNTLERLTIWDNLTQQSPGDYIVLGKIHIE